MLTAFGPDIWIAQGPEVSVLGFRYPTRMAVIRLADETLWVWSPVALTPELEAGLKTLGAVAHIVAPNSLHHVFLADWARAYPEARLCAAPGLADKRKDLSFDQEIGDAPIAGWGEGVDHVLMRGNAITTEAVFFHAPSGTALFTDLLQNYPAGWFSGWRAIVASLDLMVGAEPRTPRKFRVAFRDRDAARKSLERILAWPVDKVLMAHGTPIEAEGGAYLRRAFRWLMG